jgi:hypothetical protein
VAGFQMAMVPTMWKPDKFSDHSTKKMVDFSKTGPFHFRTQIHHSTIGHRFWMVTVRILICFNQFKVKPFNGKHRHFNHSFSTTLKDLAKHYLLKAWKISRFDFYKNYNILHYYCLFYTLKLYENILNHIKYKKMKMFVNFR